MKRGMILITVISVLSLFIGLNAFAQTETTLEPYSQAGNDFGSVRGPIYFSYDNPRYSPAYPSVLSPNTNLQPYASGGADFGSVQRPIYFSYDNPRYSPAYPSVLPPNTGLEPFAAVQPLDNPNLNASMDK